MDNNYNQNNMNNNYNNYNQNNMNNNYNNYNQNNMNGSQYNNGTYKLILNREKSFVGCLIAFKVYIDNNLVGKVRNGKTLVVDVTPGPHVVTINNGNPTNIMVNGDVTADVVVFGANNFGLTNVNVGGISQNNMGNDPSIQLSKYISQANGLLIASIVLPVVSIVLYLLTDKKYVLQFWFYGLVIGYGIVNVFGLKQIKMSNRDVYKNALIRNIVAMAIGVVAMIVTIYLVNFK